MSEKDQLTADHLRGMANDLEFEAARLRRWADWLKVRPEGSTRKA